MRNLHFIELIIFHIIFLNNNEIAAKSLQKEQYQGLISAQGLYNASDNVVSLNTTNFKKSIYADSKAWLVEFYISWCGFCLRFAPIWKRLADDIYSWRDIVVVAAIDCADDDNNPICREYEIMHYPTIKYFPVNAHSSFMGIIVEKGDSLDSLRENLVIRLEKEQEEGHGVTWPNITPYRNAEVTDVWKAVPRTIKYFFLIFEKAGSHLGTEVILDMHKIQSIHMRRATSDNELLCITNKVTKFPSLMVMSHEEPQKFINIRVPTRDGIYHAIKEYLLPKGVIIDENNSADQHKDSNSINNTKLQSIEQQSILVTNDDHLYQLDLENTLRYSISHEIPITKIIEGEKMDALKLYIEVLVKYFPLRYSNVFLEVINDVVKKKDKITGEEFIRIVKSTEEVMFPVYSGPSQWIECKGSKPIYRGYPCGLWTMFHMLTINFAMENKDNPHKNPTYILRAMHGYIKNFFSCADCSRHFIEMSFKNKIFEVQNVDENILWLWKAHNEVNGRLAGDESEDPAHKKIQYPAKEHCPQCKYENGSWNEAEVLYYLKKKYSYAGINYQDSSEKHVNKLKDDKSKIRQERLASNKYSGLKKFGWDFTIFDISICVVLYVASATILILVCIKFAVRRNYRKKGYINLLGKV